MAQKKQNAKLITVIVTVAVLLVAALLNHFFGTGTSDNYMKAGLRDDTIASDDKMYVTFIDVGQGDCTLITCGDIEVLIDGGEAGVSQTVINYLKNHNIEDIDLMIATHPHSDHIGTLSYIMSEFEVKDIIMSEIPEKITPTTSTYEKFLNSVKDNVENVIAAKAGSTYTYGELTVDILAPISNYDDLNNMSVVSKITYGTTSVMITGDAGFDSENDMLERDADYSADLLKVGHHGSKTSTSDKWLNAVNPKYAVISCGLNNNYGHPAKELISRLEKHCVGYYRTDLLGNIIFESDGKNISEVA